MAAAESGRQLPSWNVVKAYLQACGAQPAEWECDWHRVAKHVTDDAHATTLSQNTGRDQPLTPHRVGNLPSPATSQPVLAQLPHDIRGFVGRTGELDRLHHLPLDTGTDPGILPICVIDGSPGVGKTALAVHFAHEVKSQFPDGQLYVNLQSFDARQRPVSAHDALGSILRSLRMEADRIPPSTTERSTELRSLLAHRRVLIIVDDAGDAQQVRPMLPANPNCLVIVTSRLRLGGLAVHDGADRISLRRLNPDEAVVLLEQSVGAGRVSAEPDAAAELTAECAYLPLALRIAGERLATRPGGTLAALVTELRDEQKRLDNLSMEGDETAAVRAAFSRSYQALPYDQARIFRLLGLRPNTVISADKSAAATGTTHPDARRALESLADRNLLEEIGPGRYHVHDLLRIYAAELARTTSDPVLQRERILHPLTRPLARQG
jgi:hypothetical protein